LGCGDGGEGVLGGLLGGRGLGEVEYSEAVVAVWSTVLSRCGGGLGKRDWDLVSGLHEKAVKNYISECLKLDKESVAG
jgi:hypothetical protein